MATRTTQRRSAGYRTGGGYASRQGYGVQGRSYSNGRQSRNGQNPGYVYDNLARQLEEIPERQPRPHRRRRLKVYPKQRPVAMPSISGASFLFLAMAATVILLFGFQYLRVQSGLTQMKNKVVTLQDQNAETKIMNEETYQNIMDTVDLSEIYEIATEKLGMVQAVDNQVFQYKNKKSDMVKQYGDIPSASGANAR